MNRAKDFMGKELEVGDSVVYIQLHYRTLKIGTVEKITSKMLKIDDGSRDGTRQFHSQVIKVGEE